MEDLRKQLETLNLTRVPNLRDEQMKRSEINPQPTTHNPQPNTYILQPSPALGTAAKSPQLRSATKRRGLVAQCPTREITMVSIFIDYISRGECHRF